MYLINTSYGWNAGDDFIREGVLDLLGIRDESKIFVNRNQVRTGDELRPLWQVQRNSCDPDYLAKHAKGIVISGSPEWVKFFEGFYEAAISYNLPIYLVGVGMRAVGEEQLDLLRRVKHLVRGATVRDKYAASTLARAGIPHEWFPDPAFSAHYEIPANKRYRLVVNYRANGGNGQTEMLADFDPYWKEIACSIGPIDLVTVHEEVEYNRAKEIFQAPVFYSSDYRDLRRVYTDTKVYVGGRLHGAAPVIACGGTAYSLYNNIKADALRQIATFMDTLTVMEYGTMPNVREKDPGPSLMRLEKYTEQHRGYWRSRL